jgi:hypothetical protein
VIAGSAVKPPTIRGSIAAAVVTGKIRARKRYCIGFGNFSVKHMMMTLKRRFYY